ncbi:hypothetical protein T11_1878 [Trichinella zimbabwensis]|uniref:Uncharacterized protein n=1 Tax=Trichinella zimbabwensis TaxID=268475 RepID=A0A0V1F370_9BILA|nr:hypothetical protein T11_1878 [Trichinella zimbabwensis]
MGLTIHPELLYFKKKSCKYQLYLKKFLYKSDCE